MNTMKFKEIAYTRDLSQNKTLRDFLRGESLSEEVLESIIEEYEEESELNSMNDRKYLTALQEVKKGLCFLGSDKGLDLVRHYALAGSMENFTQATYVAIACRLAYMSNKALHSRPFATVIHIGSYAHFFSMDNIEPDLTEIKGTHHEAWEVIPVANDIILNKSA